MVLPFPRRDSDPDPGSVPALVPGLEEGTRVVSVLDPGPAFQDIAASGMVVAVVALVGAAVGAAVVVVDVVKAVIE